MIAQVSILGLRYTPVVIWPRTLLYVYFPKQRLLLEANARHPAENVARDTAPVVVHIRRLRPVLEDFLGLVVVVVVLLEIIVAVFSHCLGVYAGTTCSHRLHTYTH